MALDAAGSSSPFLLRIEKVKGTGNRAAADREARAVP